MDNKNETGKQDRLRVDISDPSEVEYLHRQFPTLTHEQVKEAIKNAGPMRIDIVDYLEKHKQ